MSPAGRGVRAYTESGAATLDTARGGGSMPVMRALVTA